MISFLVLFCFKITKAKPKGVFNFDERTSFKSGKKHKQEFAEQAFDRLYNGKLFEQCLSLSLLY